MKKMLTRSLKKLHERADEISVEKDKELLEEIITNLKDTLLAHDELFALSAPQIGYDKRILCLKFENNDIRTLINPMITKYEGLHFSRERDANVKGPDYIVPRHDKIILTYQTSLGKVESNIFKDVACELIEQQNNLLDGLLVCDWGLEVLPEFDEASDEDKEQVLQLYVESLLEKEKTLQKEIDENPELHQIDKTINYLTKLATGDLVYEPRLNRKQRRDKEKLEKKLKKQQNKK